MDFYTQVRVSQVRLRSGGTITVEGKELHQATVKETITYTVGDTLQLNSAFQRRGSLGGMLTYGV